MEVHSWHIPYSMHLGSSYVNDDIDGGSNTKHISNTKSHLGFLNYRHEGKYHDVDCGQGGGLNAPRDGEKSNPMLGL